MSQSVPYSGVLLDSHSPPLPLPPSLPPSSPGVLRPVEVLQLRSTVHLLYLPHLLQLSVARLMDVEHKVRDGVVWLHERGVWQDIVSLHLYLQWSKQSAVYTSYV